MDRTKQPHRRGVTVLQTAVIADSLVDRRIQHEFSSLTERSVGDLSAVMRDESSRSRVRSGTVGQGNHSQAMPSLSPSRLSGSPGRDSKYD